MCIKKRIHGPELDRPWGAKAAGWPRSEDEGAF